MTAQLALGTVQFGMRYGIANTCGRLGKDEVARVLQTARAAGIDMLDTAIAYGDAETVLGEVGIDEWRVVTKLPPVPEGTADVTGWMEAQLTASLSRLGMARLHGALLHAPDQLKGPRSVEIGRGLAELGRRGFAERVGVSVQHPDDDLPAVLRQMEPGIVQCPYSILDQALVSNGWAARLREMNCEVHVRSAFLQGLLVMPPAARPKWAGSYGDIWQGWDRWLELQGIGAVEACLRHVRSARDIDFAVVGVDNATQLEALIAVGAKALPNVPNWPQAPDRVLITPALWPRA
jgi:aryl-alcohol dehydrogenase-like predicted oxidoreductase